MKYAASAQQARLYPLKEQTKTLSPVNLAPSINICI